MGMCNKKKKQCGNCLVCFCKCKSNSAADRRRRYLKDVKAGRFTGTWNEYQAKCKRDRYSDEY